MKVIFRGKFKVVKNTEPFLEGKIYYVERLENGTYNVYPGIEAMNFSEEEFSEIFKENAE